MKYIIILFFCSLFLSCTTAQILTKLELDMSKSKVIEVLGEPGAARGSMRNHYDQVIEVWEYRFYQESGPGRDYYWLYFCNNRLIQWGRAGDWQREADRIYEMRFR